MSPLCKRRVHGHNRPEGNKFVHSSLHYIEAKECYNKREPAACACPISFCKLHIRELNMGQLWNWWSHNFSSKFLFRNYTKILWFAEVWVGWEKTDLLRVCWESAENLLNLCWEYAETLLRLCWDTAENSTEIFAENSTDSQQTLKTLLGSLLRLWDLYLELYFKLYWEH